MPHVENAASGLADYGESLGQDLVQHFLKRVVFLFFEALGTVKIVFLFRRLRGVRGRLVSVAGAESAQPLLNALAELVGLSA